MSSKQNSNYIILAIVLAVVIVAVILFFNKNSNLADENVAGEAGRHHGRRFSTPPPSTPTPSFVPRGGSCHGNIECAGWAKGGASRILFCRLGQCQLIGSVREGEMCWSDLECVTGTVCNSNKICITPSCAPVRPSTGGRSPSGRTYQN